MEVVRGLANISSQWNHFVKQLLTQLINNIFAQFSLYLDYLKARAATKTNPKGKEALKDQFAVKTATVDYNCQRKRHCLNKRLESLSGCRGKTLMKTASLKQTAAVAYRV